MRAYKTSYFVRYAVRQRVTDADLWDALEHFSDPALAVDLGHGLIRQRLARPSRQRPLGFCSILSSRSDDRALFLYGFPRDEPDELTGRDLLAFCRIASVFLELGNEAIGLLIAKGKFIEVQP